MTNLSTDALSNEDAQTFFEQEKLTLEDEIALKVDLERVVRTLNPTLQKICRLLSDGYTKTEIAEELNKSRAALEKDLIKIRRAFSSYELEIYFED